MHVVCIGGQGLIDFWRRHFQNGGLVAILDVSDSEVCSPNGFRSVTWVCFGISNFMCMSFMGMGRKKSVDFQRRHSQNGRLVIILYFLAATKQLYKWYFPSVCPSVRLSVTAFWLCSHHRIIMKFSGVNTNDQRKCDVQRTCKLSSWGADHISTNINEQSQAELSVRTGSLEYGGLALSLDCKQSKLRSKYNYITTGDDRIWHPR